jgi:hypothetical protein
VIANESLDSLGEKSHLMDEKKMKEKTCSDVDPTADRILYAGLPDMVRAAMRCAAKRWNWGREDWRMQTHLIYDALQSGRCSADAIAEGYQAGGPPC